MPRGPLLELNALQNDGGQNDMEVDEGKAGWKSVEVAVDSGAACSVLDGEAFPGVQLEESEGSRRGQRFIGAGTETMPNRGQKRYKVSPASSGKRFAMTFQDAPVRKPLAAVSGITGKDNLVVFGPELSGIIPGDSPEAAQIKKLLQQAKQRIDLKQRKGIYVMDLWMYNGNIPSNTHGGVSVAEPTTSVFSRHGK